MPEDLKVPPMPNPKPRARSNRKLLGFLFVFFITVLIILFFQSSLSKISVIQIEGNQLLSTDSIGQAAQIVPGDNFFAVSSQTVEERVRALPIVKSAKVTKHFPGVMNISVEEFPKVAFQLSADGSKQAVLADGAVIALPTGDFPLDKPILSGWADNDPNKIALCKILGDVPVADLADISEIKPDPSESYPDKIKLYTRSHFEVYTTISYLPEKIDNLPAYIASLQENHITNGIIKMLEVDNHAPFEASDGKSNGETDSTPDSSAKAESDSGTPPTKSETQESPDSTSSESAHQP